MTYSVVEPASESAVKFDEIDYDPGTFGAGMILSPITVLPNDVSFANVEMREVAGPARNIYGFPYFTNFSSESLAHYPTTEWTPLSAYNEWEDTAKFKEGCCPPPWNDGGFEWDIPVRFRVIDQVNEGELPQTQNRLQTFKMYGAGGTGNVTKLGKSVTRTP